MLVPILIALLSLSAIWITYLLRIPRRYPEAQRLAVNFIRDQNTVDKAREDDLVNGLAYFSRYLLAVDDAVVILVRTVYFRGGSHDGMAVHFVTVDMERNTVLSWTSAFEKLLEDSPVC